MYIILNVPSKEQIFVSISFLFSMFLLRNISPRTIASMKIFFFSKLLEDHLKVNCEKKFQKISLFRVSRKKGLRTKLVSWDPLKRRHRERSELSLNVEQAEYTRDALATGLSSRLFDYLVAHINSAMEMKSNQLLKWTIFKQLLFPYKNINYALCSNKINQLFLDFELKALTLGAGSFLSRNFYKAHSNQRLEFRLEIALRKQHHLWSAHQLLQAVVERLLLPKSWNQVFELAGLDHFLDDIQASD